MLLCLLLSYILTSVILIELSLYKAQPLVKAEALFQGQTTYQAFRRRDTHLWTRWRLYLVGVPFLIPRFCLIVFCVFACSVCVAISLIWSEKRGENDPIPATRQKIIKRVTIFWSRLLLYGAGFFWIREHGLLDPNATVIVSNHTSWVDILYFMTTEDFPSFLANDGLRRMPCMGKIAEGVQCLYVNRADKVDRSLALVKAENRQNAIYARKGFPKLLLFPEGTTTNGSGLLFFRKGAFITGAPVQPVGLSYPFSHYSPAMDSIPMFPQVVLLCCQLYNSLTVTRLPTVYRGSLSPEDCAEQVREDLAKHLQVPLLQDRFEEKFQFLEIAFGKKIKHS